MAMATPRRFNQLAPPPRGGRNDGSALRWLHTATAWGAALLRAGSAAVTEPFGNSSPEVGAALAPVLADPCLGVGGDHVFASVYNDVSDEVVAVGVAEHVAVHGSWLDKLVPLGDTGGNLRQGRHRSRARTRRLGRDQVHSHPHGLPRAGPRVLPTGGVAGARPNRPHRAGSDPRHGRGARARRAGNVGLTGCVPAADGVPALAHPTAQPRPEAIAWQADLMRGRRCGYPPYHWACSPPPGGTSSRRCASSPSRCCPRPPPRCIALGRSSEPTVSPTCNTNSVISRSRTDSPSMPPTTCRCATLSPASWRRGAGGGLAFTDVYVRLPAECVRTSVALTHLLEAAERLSAAALLAVPPPDPRVSAFRRWYLAEIHRQLSDGGRRPRATGRAPAGHEGHRDWSVSTRTRASFLRPAADRAVNLLGVGLKLLLAQLGRWVAFFRAVMPALAGTARMPYARFLAYNAAGGIAWGHRRSPARLRRQRLLHQGRKGHRARLRARRARRRPRPLLGWRIRKHHAERNAEQP